MGGFQLGIVIGLTVSPIFMAQGGIFGLFVIFGLSGFLWVLVWLFITKYELDYILKRHKSLLESKPKMSKVMPPFKRLLSKLPTWSLIVANAMHSWGFFVILSWMPIYFNYVYHADLRQVAWYSAVPWSVMAIIGYFGGLWLDMLIQNGKISIGFFGPAIALADLTTSKHPSTAFCVFLSFLFFFIIYFWCQEIAPQYSGVLYVEQTHTYILYNMHIFFFCYIILYVISYLFLSIIFFVNHA
ncbi:hypothetical protein UlMin_015658 [Ulmus minor]